MEATTTRMTREQYYEMTVEGDRRQLVDGAIVVNEPKFIHMVLQTELILAIGGWVAAGEGRGVVIGPTDITVDEYNVYGPDLCWWSEATRPPRELDGYPEGVPDLCAEIRSPSTWRYDVGAKRASYERGGLSELWLVDDRSQTVLVYQRSKPGAKSFDVALELGLGEALTSPQMPGFELPLHRLFPT